MDFATCVTECLANQSLVVEFDRLQGTHLSRQDTPLELMIEAGSGRIDCDLALFSQYVAEFIWGPVRVESIRQ